MLSRIVRIAYVKNQKPLSYKTQNRNQLISCMQEHKITKSGICRLDWKRWLNYQSIVKQVPFFLFLAVLAVIYIYNGHYADKTIRNINRTAKEVKELQYEYKTVKSEVMFRSKQSELVKAVEPLGLKELTAVTGGV